MASSAMVNRIRILSSFDTKWCGRCRRRRAALAAVAVGGGERLADGLLFAVGQRNHRRPREPGDTRGRSRSHARRRPERSARPGGRLVVLQSRGHVGHLQRAFGLHRRHALDAVLQLAHVARPVVGLQRRRESPGRAGSRDAIEEVLDQQRDVFLAVAQRRQVDGEDVEPVDTDPGGNGRRPPRP